MLEFESETMCKWKPMGESGIGKNTRPPGHKKVLMPHPQDW